MWKKINIFRRKASIPTSSSPSAPLAKLIIPNNPYSVQVYGWVTRDKYGRLSLHCRKPWRFRWFGEWSRGICNLPPGNFPDLKWEHEALYVTLKINYDPALNEVLLSLDK